MRSPSYDEEFLATVGSTVRLGLTNEIYGDDSHGTMEIPPDIPLDAPVLCLEYARHNLPYRPYHLF